MATKAELILLAEKWREHTELLKRIGHLPPQAPRKLADEDAPLSEFDREAIRSVRCEECLKVLPYGTRPRKQLDDLDAPAVYICRRCLSDHEHRYEKLDGDSGTKGEGRPKKRQCKNIVISDERGRVKDILVGCGEWTSEWSEEGTRTLIHKEGCQVYRARN